MGRAQPPFPSPSPAYRQVFYDSRLIARLVRFFVFFTSHRAQTPSLSDPWVNLCPFLTRLCANTRRVAEPVLYLQNGQGLAGGTLCGIQYPILVLISDLEDGVLNADT